MDNNSRYSVLALFAIVVVGCTEPSRVDLPEHGQKKYEEIFNEAMSLIESESPFSHTEASVVQFKERFPDVIEMLLRVSATSRIRLISTDSTKEVVNERTMPITGALHFADGSTMEFVEFRKKCRYGAEKSEVLLILRVKRSRSDSK